MSKHEAASDTESVPKSPPLSTLSRLRYRPSDRGDDQPASPSGRTNDTRQVKQEAYASMIKYIRASPRHKRTSCVPGSLQDLAMRL